MAEFGNDLPYGAYQLVGLRIGEAGTKVEAMKCGRHPESEQRVVVIDNEEMRRPAPVRHRNPDVVGRAGIDVLEPPSVGLPQSELCYWRRTRRKMRGEDVRPDRTLLFFIDFFTEHIAGIHRKARVRGDHGHDIRSTDPKQRCERIRRQGQGLAIGFQFLQPCFDNREGRRNPRGVGNPTVNAEGLVAMQCEIRQRGKLPDQFASARHGECNIQRQPDPAIDSSAIVG